MPTGTVGQGTMETRRPGLRRWVGPMRQRVQRGYEIKAKEEAEALVAKAKEAAGVELLARAEEAAG